MSSSTLLIKGLMARGYSLKGIRTFSDIRYYYYHDNELRTIFWVKVAASTSIKNRFLVSKTPSHLISSIDLSFAHALEINIINDEDVDLFFKLIS